MSTRLDPLLMEDIRKYGAFEVDACFNCGNCTAVCPLSDAGAAFPRLPIRWAHLGMKKRLLEGREPWLCYFCGECSKTCPRTAEPANFMAALRRYSIAQADVTGVAGLLYKNGILNFLATTALAALFALFIYSEKLRLQPGDKLIEVFNIPFEVIHWLGIGMMSLAGISLAVGVMLVLKRSGDFAGLARKLIQEFSRRKMTWVRAAVKTGLYAGFTEAFGHKRFRTCDGEKTYSWWRKPWFLHATVMWGFTSLFTATSLNFLFKDPAILVPLWWPPRIIGSLGGILLMYGTTMIGANRLRKTEKSYAQSLFSDWWLLGALWLAGLTGFILEYLVYIPKASQPAWTDLLFLVHVGISMELILLVPFTKFAHVFYRTLALFFHAFNGEIGRQTTQEESK
jgi:ferredoxin/nitrate reductase gamma subunit